MPRVLPFLLVIAAASGLLTACSPEANSPTAPSTPRAKEEVTAFLHHYFKTWSDQDMDGYAACFHETARITWLPEGKGEPRFDSLSDFLHGQRLSHQTAAEPMRETADHIEILMDDRAALARVQWTLVKGNNRTTGIDHFSLAHTPSGWRITHLLVYSTP